MSLYKKGITGFILQEYIYLHYCIKNWKSAPLWMEKRILCMYRWWKRKKRIAYLSKILSPEVESNQVHFYIFTADEIKWKVSVYGR